MAPPLTAPAAGLTLAEVAVALALLGVGLLAVAGLITHARVEAHRSGQRSAASAAVDAALTEWLRVDRSVVASRAEGAGCRTRRDPDCRIPPDPRLAARLAGLGLDSPELEVRCSAVDRRPLTAATLIRIEVRLRWTAGRRRPSLTLTTVRS